MSALCAGNVDQNLHTHTHQKTPTQKDKDTNASGDLVYRHTRKCSGGRQIVTKETSSVYVCRRRRSIQTKADATCEIIWLQNRLRKSVDIINREKSFENGWIAMGKVAKKEGNLSKTKLSKEQQVLAKNQPGWQKGWKNRIAIQSKQSR